ncbi:MAG: hypothetical protein MJ100_02135 [Ruminococcus sp.]|nr:hypothetical protein [Ruminococcus sp.]
MTDKEFKRLKRSELLEIIYEFQKREQVLNNEINRLKSEIQLRDMKIAESMSVTEAVEKLNSVLGSTLSSSEKYLDEVRAFCSENEKRSAEMLENARREAEKIITQAKGENAETHEMHFPPSKHTKRKLNINYGRKHSEHGSDTFYRTG